MKDDNMNFKKIVDDYRITYHTFEKYEERIWTAEINIIELYKQIGEIITTKDNNKEQYKDELLDTLCQIFRLMDYYKYDIYKAYNMSKRIYVADDNDILLKLIENIGSLSKCIMIKEKYYFKTRVNEPKYNISDEKMMNCFSKHIAYVLKMADKEQIDLNKVSDNLREIDRKYFEIIEKENK